MLSWTTYKEVAAVPSHRCNIARQVSSSDPTTNMDRRRAKLAAGSLSVVVEHHDLWD